MSNVVNSTVNVQVQSIQFSANRITEVNVFVHGSTRFLGDGLYEVSTPSQTVYVMEGDWIVSCNGRLEAY